MRTYEEIGKAITQGFLFINNEKYYITEVKSVRGASIFMITDESRTFITRVNVQSGTWTTEPTLSAEDKARLEVLAELGYNYIRNYDSTIQISHNLDFNIHKTLYSFDSIPEGTYEIGEHYELLKADYQNNNLKEL